MWKPPCRTLESETPFDGLLDQISGAVRPSAERPTPCCKLIAAAKSAYGKLGDRQAGGSKPWLSRPDRMARARTAALRRRPSVAVVLAVDTFDRDRQHALRYAVASTGIVDAGGILLMKGHRSPR